MSESAIPSKRPNPLRVLQLTDPHLMADPFGELLGIRTRESLDAVIDQVRGEGRVPDLIIASGDIAQDGSQTAYRAFRDRVSVFDCPVIWFAGNHDDVPSMNAVIEETESARRRVLTGGWQFIGLDSSVPGHVHGALSDDELQYLRDCLAECPKTPTLVALHHHPVDVGCDWMAAIGVRNGAELMDLLRRSPQVKIVLWGHIHQVFDRVEGHLRMLASPSTCIQFAPDSSDFAVDQRSPGYRWLELGPDGDVDTWVRRVDHFEMTVELDSDGY
ncbi:3',5'-cyclic-AMP phosphodiesterase [Tamilnaduibacter salinus]|uniref:3',5'-cyclic-AMP phosphodiesterase n=1 Tax=Tamilnaduibacter salinus TaxID=1484056 RepID=A0A2A2I4A4_9GAMM|nr:3',5'-cyclic-AMP phosphodiesterase [Tamilnaduibacter salinus]PAV25863.1 3',5'-cyclic-AMP phosphodiesterase [Tamilnaduibacter salinus]